MIYHNFFLTIRFVKKDKGIRIGRLFIFNDIEMIDLPTFPDRYYIKMPSEAPHIVVQQRLFIMYKFGYPDALFWHYKYKIYIAIDLYFIRTILKSIKRKWFIYNNSLSQPNLYNLMFSTNFYNKYSISGQLNSFFQQPFIKKFTYKYILKKYWQP